MRKIYKNLMLLGLGLMGLSLNAQYYYVPGMINGNPKNLNNDAEFPQGGGLDASWTAIQNGGVPANAPVWSSVSSIPFPFFFNNNLVSQYKVSTSGVLTFDVTASNVPSATKSTLPNAGIPDNSVCVWGLAAPGANDKIMVKTFGTAPNRQHWVFFSSYDVVGASCWTYFSIVFEETSNHIYIMDKRNACQNVTLSLGVQINSNTAYMVPGSPSYAIQAGTNAAPDDNVAHIFVPGTIRDRDAAGLASATPQYLALVNAPFDLSGVFGNWASQNINSYKMSYSINGGAAVTSANVSQIVPSLQSATLSATGWNPGTPGNYNVKLWISEINGSSDEYNLNDTIEMAVVVVPDVRQRRPLMEVFSSSTCGPCAPANATFKQLMDQQPVGNFNKIKYQMSWPGSGDPYFTQEAQTRRALYAVNSVPRMQIDGQWDGHAGQATQAIIDQFRAVPAFVELDAAYQIDGQKVSTQIEFTPVASLSGNIRLFAAIYEKTTEDNKKSNGENIFYDVFKKFLTPDQGQLLTNMNEGVKQSINLDYTFNGTYILPPNATSPVNHATNHTVEEFSDLAVMVWVQDMSSKEILQSYNAHFGQLGVENVEVAVQEVKLFPNPAQNEIHLDMMSFNTAQVEYQVYNALGQAVMAGSIQNANEAQQTLSVASLRAGYYFIHLRGEGLDKKIKFNVAR